MSYLEQLHSWIALCDRHNTPSQMAQVQADQDRRIACMSLAGKRERWDDLFVIPL